MGQKMSKAKIEQWMFDNVSTYCSKRQGVWWVDDNALVEAAAAHFNDYRDGFYYDDYITAAYKVARDYENKTTRWDV